MRLSQGKGDMEVRAVLKQMIAAFKDGSSTPVKLCMLIGQELKHYSPGDST